jgi:hypothetical protein
MWNEAVVKLLNVLSRNFPGRAAENHKKAQQEEPDFVRDLNARSPVYEAKIITVQPLKMIC